MPRVLPLVVAIPLILAALSGSAVSGQGAEPEATWTAELGGFRGIEDVQVLSATDIWAVGSSVVHYDGHAWTTVKDGGHHLGLTALSMYAPTYGWAVGAEKLLRIQNGDWGQPLALPGVRLYDVVMLGPWEGWAVGDSHGRGRVYRYDGMSWFPVDIPPTPGLRALWMPEPGQGWAVGEAGAMLHLQDGVWSAHPALVEDTLRGIAGTGRGDVWAVGGDGSRGSDRHHSILHFDGERWSVTLSEPGAALHDVAVRGDEGWAVGDSQTRMHLADGAWIDLGEILPFGDLGIAYTAVSFVPGQEGAIALAESARITQLIGDTAVDLHAFYLQLSDYSGLAMLSASDGWAIGPTRPALRYDGDRWRRDPMAILEDMSDIDGTRSDDVWAVGRLGVVMHFDGSLWSQATRSTFVDLHRVSIAPSGEGWAVGWQQGRADEPDTGVVIQLNQGQWQLLWETTEPLVDVDGMAADDVWAITRHRSWHYDGRTWTGGPVGGLSIDMVARDLGWIGGEGAIFRYDGTGWTHEVGLPGAVQVNDLEMAADGTGWAVAHNGMVLYRDGFSWRAIRGANLPDPSSGDPYLSAVEVITAGDQADIWVSGFPDSILHGRQRRITLPTPTAATPTSTAGPTVATAPTEPPTPTQDIPIPTASPAPPSPAIHLPSLRRGR